MLKNIKELKQLLENKIQETDFVVISPHKGTDCDAIAGALAMSLIAKKFDKESVILLEDKIKLENAVKIILSELPESIKIVTPNELDELLANKKVLLVTTDTNKTDLVPIDDYSRFSDIILIDHHDIGEKTISTEYKYIDLNTSSVSEIMYKLLGNFGIKYQSQANAEGLRFNMANYLLAGISLDTAKFTQKTSSTTFKVISDLMSKGADLNYVNDLFLDDFEKDMLFLDLVRATTWKMFNIAIALNNENPNFIYDKETLAKAADWVIKYRASDLAFAIGLIDPNCVYVSGRSKGIINVGELLTQLGGGGNAMSGAAKIESNDVKAIKLRLDDVIRPGYKIKE